MSEDEQNVRAGEEQPASPEDRRVHPRHLEHPVEYWSNLPTFPPQIPGAPDEWVEVFSRFQRQSEQRQQATPAAGPGAPSTGTVRDRHTPQPGQPGQQRPPTPGRR
jgi:hypothetical protein